MLSVEAPLRIHIIKRWKTASLTVWEKRNIFIMNYSLRIVETYQEWYNGWFQLTVFFGFRLFGSFHDARCRIVSGSNWKHHVPSLVTMMYKKYGSLLPLDDIFLMLIRKGEKLIFWICWSSWEIFMKSRTCTMSVPVTTNFDWQTYCSSFRYWLHF